MENLDDKLNDRKFIANARTDVPELARRLKLVCEYLTAISELVYDAKGKRKSFKDFVAQLEAPLEER